MAGVEEAAMHRPSPGAGPSVQEQGRLAARIPDLLPVHDVAARQGQQAGFERRDIGEKVATGHASNIRRSGHLGNSRMASNRSSFVPGGTGK
jgi:hypothetical protein